MAKQASCLEPLPTPQQGNIIGPVSLTRKLEPRRRPHSQRRRAQILLRTFQLRDQPGELGGRAALSQGKGRPGERAKSTCQDLSKRKFQLPPYPVGVCHPGVCVTEEAPGWSAMEYSSPPTFACLPTQCQGHSNPSWKEKPWGERERESVCVVVGEGRGAGRLGTWSSRNRCYFLSGE